MGSLSPFGATLTGSGTEFRVWAPKCASLEVVLKGQDVRFFPLERDPHGFFHGLLRGAKHGDRYQYRLDHNRILPDPCSRYQPDGPHGDSVIVDPGRFEWHDQAWNGVSMKGQIIYELHLGTFTPEGTFDAATNELEELREAGFTIIEIMPVHECAGRWNWGYDGVDLFAPYHVYGEPDAFRRFVDRAHHIGLGVILDVVYNHLGPDGNYLESFSDTFFTDRIQTDWGKAINFDGPGSGPVREFFINNACYWISEFHVDGLRLDATHSIYDWSSPHILADISIHTRRIADPRSIILIAENETQDVRCITPVEQGGFGLDAIWNDDYHHCARVALVGPRESYLADYNGRPSEWIALTKRGFLYQGQYSMSKQHPRGTPITTEPASALVNFTQNHDQISNHLDGKRLYDLSGRERYRAITALMMLSPGTPLLFMGQEYEATNPFLFFVDHKPELHDPIRNGRREFLSQFPTYAKKEFLQRMADPISEQTFKACVLDRSERERHNEAYLFHKDLIALRKTDPVIADQNWDAVDGAGLGESAFVIRFFGNGNGDRLLVINLGTTFLYAPSPEPLLAPPAQSSWKLGWRSNDPRYGGPNEFSWNAQCWNLPEQSALFFVAAPSPKD